MKRHGNGIKKRVALLFVSSICLLILSGCYRSGDLYISADTFKLGADCDADDIPIVSAHVNDTSEAIVTADTPDTSASPETTAPTETAAPQENDPYGTVYWVKSGEVWHVKRECPSLSRSKNILWGTVEDATESGKTRACRRCK